MILLVQCVAPGIQIVFFHGLPRPGHYSSKIFVMQMKSYVRTPCAFHNFFLSVKILDPENAKEYEGRDDTRVKKITQMGGI